MKIGQGITRAVVLTAILVWALAEEAALGDVFDGYHRKWSGALDGNDCYFTPVKMISGNFLKWAGEELLIIDPEGFGHILEWERNRFVVRWVTDKSVAVGHIRDAAPADLKGTGLSSTVFLNDKGQLSVLGTEAEGFRHICDGCLAKEWSGLKIQYITAADYDSDKKDDLLALTLLEGSYQVVVLKWGGKEFTGRKIMPTDLEMGKTEYLEIFANGAGRAAGKYYVPANQPGGKGRILTLQADEEGLATVSEKPLGDAGRIPSDLEEGAFSSRASESGFFYSEIKSGGRQELVFSSRDTGKVDRYAGFPEDADFFLPMDLNGNGVKELVFADYDCKMEVHTKAKFKIIIDGEEVSLGRDIKRLSGDRVFISVSIIPGAEAKNDKDTTVVSRSGRKLIFDHQNNSVWMKSPDSEENLEVKVPYIKEPDRLYIDPLAAARHLGFKCEWDSLAERLNITFPGGKKKK